MRRQKSSGGGDLAERGWRRATATAAISRRAPAREARRLELRADRCEGRPQRGLRPCTARASSPSATAARCSSRPGDDGKTWTKKDLGTDANLYSIAWVNDTFYVGGDHVVLFSKDAGQTFRIERGRRGRAPHGVHVERRRSRPVPGPRADAGFVAKAVLGENDELETFDVASLAWKKVTVEGATDLTGISFSFSTGIVSGKGGFVADSIDLGATWKRASRR